MSDADDGQPTVAEAVTGGGLEGERIGVPQLGTAEVVGTIDGDDGPEYVLHYLELNHSTQIPVDELGGMVEAGEVSLL